jgi:hypothetical protein
MLRRVVWYKFTDVSEMFATSIIKVNRPDDGGSKRLRKSVKFYQTKRSNIPEDSHLRTRCRENLKSHLRNFIYLIRADVNLFRMQKFLHDSCSVLLHTIKYYDTSFI